MRLAGKAALITGGGSGFGRATAIRFGREGAMVAVSDWNAGTGAETVALINEQGGNAIFIHGDVSQAADCARMVQTTVDTFGRIDILYNNAGIAINKPALETSEEEWLQIINVHLKGAFLLSKFAIPHMQRQGGGSIINTGSVGGIVGVPGNCAYGPAKAGLILLGKILALEHAKDNIRVNAIAPGVHDTPMLRKFVDEAPDPEAALKTLAGDEPVGRLGTAEDVANLVLFLASDEASFCTGAVFPVDGGYTAQ